MDQGVTFRRRNTRGSRTRRPKITNSGESGPESQDENCALWETAVQFSVAEQGNGSSARRTGLLRAPTLQEYTTNLNSGEVSYSSTGYARQVDSASSTDENEPHPHSKFQSFENVTRNENMPPLEEIKSHLFGTGDQSDDSAESAWEREQLRRAGQGHLSVETMVKTAAISRARSIFEEEGRNRGGRGEIGSSVAFTCVANLDAAIDSTRGRLAKIQGEIEAVQSAASRNTSEENDTINTWKEATSRHSFYIEFSQFVKDVSEMLSETAADTVTKVNADMEHLASMAKERASEVDEFGRAKRSFVAHDGDGFETPPRHVARTIVCLDQYQNDAIMDHDFLDASATGILRPSANVKAFPESDLEKVNAVESDGDSNFASESGMSSNFKDPLHGVRGEYKSIEAIVGRFAIWKERYPGDYEAAFGDLLMGKLCGALALATQLSSGTAWLVQIPTLARGAAVIKSRAMAWTALRVAAEWEPQSKTSSHKFAKLIRDVLTSLTGYKLELKLAVDAYRKIIGDILEWKVASLLGLASHGHDSLWLARAAVKCANGVGLVALPLLATEPDSCRDIEDVVISQLFGSIICKKVSALEVGNDEDQGQSIQLLLFAVEYGCVCELNIEKELEEEIQFPLQTRQQWKPVRNALLRARDAAMEEDHVDLQQRLRTCLRKVGIT